MEQYGSQKPGVAKFSSEASAYCQGISDIVARDYAVQYARLLADRARGFDTDAPKPPHGLFEPHRNLIRSTLDRICAKYVSEE